MPARIPLTFTECSKIVRRVDRIAAAWIAGYTPKGKDQITALLGAINDPNSTARNNSIRVLAVLAGHDPNLARQISTEPFIPMLNSLIWTDRNKAMAILDPITAARDPKTLESLRDKAADPLRQMSQWTYWGHASMALTLLGRAKAIAEDRLQNFDQGPQCHGHFGRGRVIGAWDC
ncbi:MAG: hypothetical protein ACRD7E_19150 [Bryobacteraceae bacterium]